MKKKIDKIINLIKYDINKNYIFDNVFYKRVNNFLI